MRICSKLTGLITNMLEGLIVSSIDKFKTSNPSVTIGYVGFDFRRNAFDDYVPLPTNSKEIKMCPLLVARHSAFVSMYPSFDNFTKDGFTAGSRSNYSGRFDVEIVPTLIVTDDNYDIASDESSGYYKNNSLIGHNDSPMIVCPYKKADNFYSIVDILVVNYTSFTDSQILDIMSNFEEGAIALVGLAEYGNDIELYFDKSKIHGSSAFVSSKVDFYKFDISGHDFGEGGTPENLYFYRSIYFSKETSSSEVKKSYNKKITSIIDLSRKGTFHHGKVRFSKILRSTYNTYSGMITSNTNNDSTGILISPVKSVMKTRGDARYFNDVCGKVMFHKEAYRNSLMYSIAKINHNVFFRSKSRKTAINTILASSVMTGTRYFGYELKHFSLVRNIIMKMIVEGSYANYNSMIGIIKSITKPNSTSLITNHAHNGTDNLSKIDFNDTENPSGVYSFKSLLSYVDIKHNDAMNAFTYETSRRIILPWLPGVLYASSGHACEYYPWQNGAITSGLIFMDEIISIITGANEPIGIAEFFIESYLNYISINAYSPITYSYDGLPFDFKVKFNHKERSQVILGKECAKLFFDNLFELVHCYYSEPKDSLSDKDVLFQRVYNNNNGPKPVVSSKNQQYAHTTPKKYKVFGDVRRTTTDRRDKISHNLMAAVLGWIK